MEIHEQVEEIHEQAGSKQVFSGMFFMCSLLVDVVTAKAADLSANFSRFTAGRRPKWPSLSADSAHQLADIQNTL